MTRRRRQQNIYHECSEPLCHQIIPIDQRYCPQHKEQHEQEWQQKKNEYRRSKLGQMIKASKVKQYDQTERDQQAVKFYHSPQWEHVRDYVYARDGATCQSCGNVIKDRKIVDHVVPRRLCSNQEALDSSNLWVLCPKCHFRKTKLEQIISQQPHGDTKLQHLDRDWWTKVLKEKKGTNNK